MAKYSIPTRYLLPFFFVTLFITQLGLSLSDLPSVKLMQDIACKKIHGILSDELLPEEECRDPEVQRVLNRVDMGISVSVTIGSALVAFPLGMLADRIGRVPVLGASVFSLFLSQGYAMLVCWKWKTVPLEAMWAIGGFLILGGGQRMAEAMVFTMIADVASKSQRASWFQWVVAAVLSGELAGPFLSAHLIQTSIWAPLFWSLALIFIGGVLLAFLSPETRAEKPVNIDGTVQNDQPVTAKATVISIFSRPAIYYLPGAVLSIPIAATQSNILLRFMPIQFKWEMAKSVLLMSLRSMVTLITLLVILPGATYLANRRTDWSHQHRDSVFVRVSSFCFLAGSVFLTLVMDEGFVIGGVVISALGSGITTLCRSMLVSALAEKNSGMLFGMLAIGEVTGFLCCTLAMGALFDVAFTTWIGYPFVLGVALASIIFVVSWMAGTGSQERNIVERPVVLETVDKPAGV